ncbi:Flavin monooxygenase-like protein [Corchorus olitorius]|uniref:Flavin-containing monooxygenase n=1 Tax=Corchorus olitorius TaxID=93759 RepID=A0A1R3IUW7_9ROSI|nr:Flavin monooxygenase-like protein [Corchorus olitorius]
MAQENPPFISKIAIIGAGVSGIAAAKQLAHHNPLVFEASDSIGGVWKSCSYNSTKLQSARKDYEFSDFPWPNRDDSSFPSYLEILDYLESYAKHFDVLKFVKFNSKVVELRFIGDRETAELTGNAGEYRSPLPGHPVWEIAVQTNDSEILQWYAFEYVVVCVGKYGDIPKIPSFPHNKGPETFQGKVLHSLDYCKLNKEAASQLLQGKKVVIVGFKKSAIDLAVECAEANQGPGGKPCTMVRRGVSKFIESYLLWKLPLEKYGLKPDHPFEEDYASCQMAIMPENFFTEADKGNIAFKKASKWWFSKEGIEFDDNTKLEADVVILATGYDGKKKLKSILPEPFRSLLAYPSGIMPLYRGTIHPLVPNMAFLGYIESVSNLHTSELRSMWLARLIDEKFKLPSAENMIEQISRELEVMRRTTRFYKRHCISTFSINHSDEMCEEMGWNSWRKKNWVSEAFSPYGSQDYGQEK